MMLLPIVLMSALVGRGASQDPSPTASAAAMSCHVQCFSQFMEDMNNSCKGSCICAGSSFLSNVECCVTNCAADQHANVTVSIQNACSDGKSLQLDYTCGPNTTTAATSATTSVASTPTSLTTSIILISAQTVEGSAATGTIGAGGIGGGGQGASIVGLGVGLGVGLPLAAVLVGGLTLLWKRSHKKKEENRNPGHELGSNLGMGGPDGVGRTFVFPSTMVLPSPGLPPDAEAGSLGDHKEYSEITPFEVLGNSRRH